MGAIPISSPRCRDRRDFAVGLIVNIRGFALPGRRLTVTPHYIWSFMQNGKIMPKNVLKKQENNSDGK